MSGRETAKHREPEYSRRRFLQGLVVAVPSIVLIAELTIPDVLPGPNLVTEDQQLEVDKKFAETVKAGIRKDWRKASVWPGAAIVPENVELFSTPNLNHKTHLDWPAAGKHLLVQRPFMMDATIAMNGLQGDHPYVPPEVMGFWLPDSNDIAYFDRQQFKSDIWLPTHTREAVFLNNYETVKGENITLEPAVHRDGLDWRYLVADHYTYLNEPPTHITKVCGRSIAERNIVKLQEYYQDFVETPRQVIKLPEG